MAIAIIELLMEGPLARQAERQSSRTLQSKSTLTAGVAGTDLQPARVRIRSALLLDLLEEITSSKLGHRKAESQQTIANISVVFLHPFKLFITYQQEIRERARQPRAEWTRKDDQATSSNPNETSLSKSGDNHLATQDALLELDLLLDLFDQQLKPVFDLHDSLRKGETKTILFQDLWLLFHVGELVYERKPGRQCSGTPPRLCRVTQFQGGRPILNNKPSRNTDPLRNKVDQLFEKESKGKQDKFTIRFFTLHSDGENLGPMVEAYGIPAWDTPRDIRELKVYPEHFCIAGEDFPNVSLKDWKDPLIHGGMSFADFRPGALRYYDGIGFGTNSLSYKVWHTDVSNSIVPTNTSSVIFSGHNRHRSGSEGGFHAISTRAQHCSGLQGWRGRQRLHSLLEQSRQRWGEADLGGIRRSVPHRPYLGSPGIDSMSSEERAFSPNDDLTFSLERLRQDPPRIFQKA